MNRVRFTTVGEHRGRFGITVLGGPTTVIDVAGWRLVVDPTFDPPGQHGYLTKTAGPAAPPSALGAVDVVLISHDQHPDNLDDEGRRFALAAPLVLPIRAQRSGWDRRHRVSGRGKASSCPQPTARRR